MRRRLVRRQQLHPFLEYNFLELHVVSDAFNLEIIPECYGNTTEYLFLFSRFDFFVCLYRKKVEIIILFLSRNC